MIESLTSLLTFTLYLIKSVIDNVKELLVFTYNLITTDFVWSTSKVHNIFLLYHWRSREYYYAYLFLSCLYHTYAITGWMILASTLESSKYLAIAKPIWLEMKGKCRKENVMLVLHGVMIYIFHMYKNKYIFVPILCRLILSCRF